MFDMLIDVSWWLTAAMLFCWAVVAAVPVVYDKWRIGNMKSKTTVTVNPILAEAHGGFQSPSSSISISPVGVPGIYDPTMGAADYLRAHNEALALLEKKRKELEPEPPRKRQITFED